MWFGLQFHIVDNMSTAAMYRWSVGEIKGLRMQSIFEDAQVEIVRQEGGAPKSHQRAHRVWTTLLMWSLLFLKKYLALFEHLHFPLMYLHFLVIYKHSGWKFWERWSIQCQAFFLTVKVTRLFPTQYNTWWHGWEEICTDLYLVNE